MVLSVDVVRPDDLVYLRVEAENLVLDTSDGAHPVLVVDDASKRALLTVVFPPQTIHEPAYFEAAVVPVGDDGGTRKDLDKGNTAVEPLDPPGQAQAPRRTTAQLGHPSRLVFTVPPGTRIPYTTAGLLDWSKFTLNVNPIAAIGFSPTPDEIKNAPDIARPRPDETAIELPYRLVISPTAQVTWQHRPDPFTFHGQTELWHTRLGLGTAAKPEELSWDAPASLRAIWSPDYNPYAVPPPAQRDPDLGRTAMSANDRHQIVVLTSAFQGYEGEIDIDLFLVLDPFRPGSAAGQGKKTIKLTVPYVPQPFQAEQLILSALGGWLRSRGHWDLPHTAPPPVWVPIKINDLLKHLDQPRRILTAGADAAVAEAALARAMPAAAQAAAAGGGRGLIAVRRKPEQYQLDLSEWVHVATLGRDHYVRIVYEGELWPFRHRAALVKVTERKFVENNGIVAAYLIQRMFIVVREPEKAFSLTDRANPLKTVRLTTTVTPDIADPVMICPGCRSFWVEVVTDARTLARQQFAFHAVGTDLGGNAVDFTVPLMFVSISDVADATRLAAVAAEYNAQANIEKRNVVIPGQKVLFAEPDTHPAATTDNTQLVTRTLNYVVDAVGSPPTVYKATVNLHQVQELLGTDAATTIAFHPDFVANGMDAATGVFATVVKEDLSKYIPTDPLAAITGDILKVEFSADKAGGFATPNLGVSTLTRALGPLAGKAADALTGTFDPASFFPKGTASIFGCFDLLDLLPPGLLGKNAPKMSVRTKDIAGGKLITTTLDWHPDLHSPVTAGPALFETNPGADLTVKGTIEKPISLSGGLAGAVTSDFTGTFTNFQVTVLSSVTVKFTEFTFEALTGHKPKVVVKLDPTTPVTFSGDLKFVEELRQAIPPDLFGKGPSLDLSPTGVRAGFAFALPPLAVGVFALKDVSLGAALTLPFLDGKPSFDFNVSERHHPFLLTVSLFGGGGFFHLQLDTAGMKQLEASLEFGAAAAIDIGVASGEVHIMAGIYFSLQRKEGTTDLLATLTGYLRMGGSLSVLGLIKVSVEFNLSFTYDGARDKAFGRATLTVEVEVAFFSKSVELTVERAFGGSGDPTFVDLFTTPAVWSEYALAFA